MLPQHLTFSSDGRLPLFPGEAPRRAAVSALVRVAGPSLLMFNVVDDQVHVLLFRPARGTGALARALLLALRPLTATPLFPADVRPVDGPGHLLWLVRYILLQSWKHGLAEHPALWSGSCFQDLVGARRIPGWSPPLSQALPRWRLREAHAILGLPPGRLEPLSDLSGLAPPRLIAAAAAALGVDPALVGRHKATVRARRVAAALLATAGLPTRFATQALEVDRSTALRLAEGVDPLDLQAALRRLALEEQVAALPPLAAEPDLSWSP